MHWSWMDDELIVDGVPMPRKIKVVSRRRKSNAALTVHFFSLSLMENPRLGGPSSTLAFAVHSQSFHLIW